MASTAGLDAGIQLAETRRALSVGANVHDRMFASADNRMLFFNGSRTSDQGAM